MPIGLLQEHAGQVREVDPSPAPPPLPGGAAEIVRFFMEVPQWIQIGGVIFGAIAAVVATVLALRHRKRIWSWVAEIPATVKAITLAVVVALGAVVSVAGYQVYDFVEHDNRFCTGCHVMADAFVRFDESAHSTLGCKECHAQPKTESARQLYLWVLDRPEEVGPGHSPVPDARCTSCHVDEDPERWPQIAASLGHRVHFDSDDPELGELMCVSCHGVTVHEFAPAATTCGDCHEAEAGIRLGRMAAETELHCVACHDFLATEPTELPGAPEGMAMLPDRAQCVACHQMGDLLVESELAADPHGAVCGVCHNPHTQDTPADAIETCLGCHTEPETLTVFHTGTHAPVLPQCTACHFAHSWEVEGSDCLSCHATIMDRPPGRTSGLWSTPPEGAGGATVGGAAPEGATVGTAPGWHPVAGGLDNGGPVELPEVTPAASARPSPETASRERALLARHGSPDAGGRLPGRAASGLPSSYSSADTIPRPFVHHEHAVLSCEECHGRDGEHGVVTVRTPQQCAACHHDPARPWECGDCHPGEQYSPLRQVASTMSLTVRDEPFLRDLPFDHELHGTLECRECHTGPVMLAVERECASCHQDHHRPEADCARCHLPAEPGVHGLQVHLTCTSSGCHAGEAGERPALTRTLCLACHQEQRDHEPGLSCQGCHMVPVDPPLRRGGGTASGAAHEEAA